MRQPWTRKSVPVVLAACTFLIAPRARAYRTATDGAVLRGAGSVAWAEREISFALYLDSIPSGIQVEDLERALEAAISTWSAPTCTSVRLTYAGRTNTPPSAMNGVNTIAWVSGWTSRSFPSYSAGATDVQYFKSAGGWQIAEADVYLNADLSWSFGGAGDTRDIQAVLTHEFGHALGLLHPCEPDGSDDAPRCDSGSYEDETMYPLYEVGASSLASDDVAGVCFLYPVRGGCGSCSADQSCVDGECVTRCGGETCKVREKCSIFGCAPTERCDSADCTGATCQSDGACAPFAICKGGICTRGTTEASGPCSATADCRAGVCAGGYCVTACSQDADCLSGTCVVASEVSLRGCSAAGKLGFGAACVSANQCASGLCASDDEHLACTARCEADAACPASWRCIPIDGASVCARPPTFPSGGCGISTGRDDSTPWGHVALAACTAIRRRRRKKQ